MCTTKLVLGWALLSFLPSPATLSAEDDENARRPERFNRVAFPVEEYATELVRIER